LLLSYDKIKHLVEVDENILAVFTLKVDGKISDMFIAEDAKIDRSFIENIGSKLDSKFEAINEVATTKDKKEQMIGKHLWDISEYDNIRAIKIYEDDLLIVVLARSHTPLGTTADSVLGYVYECNEDKEQEQQEECPPCLF
jgi:hypothetical protein